MERRETPDNNDNGHVIDITSITEPSVNRSTSQQIENLPSSNPVIQHSFSTTNGTNDHNSSPPNTICGLESGTVCGLGFELVLTMSQIIAAIVALCVSKHEHRHALLFTWLIVYAFARVATIPVSIRFYYHEEKRWYQDPSPTFRLEVVDYVKIGMIFFFVVWFFVGQLWVFDEQSSASDSPILHGLYLVFYYYTLVFNVVPFILLAALVCCLPCICLCCNPFQNREATPDWIISLPTYKFKIKKHKHGSNSGPHESTTKVGIVAAGTENERVLSGEDAVCRICLANYANNDELRQLWCTHFFHKHCVDKWLKVNAWCPLCTSGRRV